MRVRQRGVTLTELMIVTVLAALLASIGIPSYTATVNRARVTRAIADIGVLSLQLQRWQSSLGSFPRTLAEANLDGVIDPWGNPYVYLDIKTARTGQVRRDRNLRPINTDFDLYSMGPDGRTQTQLMGAQARDDIVRASDGSFIGIAKDY